MPTLYICFPYSPAAEVGKPALLDKVFSLLIISLLDICNNIHVGVLTLGQLKIFKMAVAKRGRFVFISGRKHETIYFGLLEYGIFKFYEKNMFIP